MSCFTNCWSANPFVRFITCPHKISRYFIEPVLSSSASFGCLAISSWTSVRSVVSSDIFIHSSWASRAAGSAPSMIIFCSRVRAIGWLIVPSCASRKIRATYSGCKTKASIVLPARFSSGRISSSIPFAAIFGSIPNCSTASKKSASRASVHNARTIGMDRPKDWI